MADPPVEPPSGEQTHTSPGLSKSGSSGSKSADPLTPVEQTIPTDKVAAEETDNNPDGKQRASHASVLSDTFYMAQEDLPKLGKRTLLSGLVDDSVPEQPPTDQSQPVTQAAQDEGADFTSKDKENPMDQLADQDANKGHSYATANLDGKDQHPQSSHHETIVGAELNASENVCPSTVATASQKKSPEDKYSEWDLRFGWWKFKPNFLQGLRKPWIMLLGLSMAGVIQGMVVNGFVLSSISTIERRFSLRSSETGLIASGYDIASLVLLIPVSYIGGAGNKPKWVGVGVLIMSLGMLLYGLPHFLVGYYQPYTTDLMSGCLRYEGTWRTVEPPFGIDRKLCGPDAVDRASDSLRRFKYMFLVGQFLHGAGASPLYTLGVSYMDENLSPQASSLYCGIFYGLAILGPAIGFMAGGQLLKVYTDITVDPRIYNLTPDKVGWVGAWWIGFLICAALGLVVGIFICALPPLLPGRDERRGKIEQEWASKETKLTSASVNCVSGKMIQLMRAVLLLVTNPVFMLLNVAAFTEGFVLSGFATYAPKFVENQFFRTASTASTLVGAIVVPAGAGGTVLGGFIIKHFNMKWKTIAKACILFITLSVLSCIVFSVQCPNLNFAGVDFGTGVAQLNQPCNEVCSCSRQLYQPVCGSDALTYFSPCHAGCDSRTSSKQDGLATFSNCTCVGLSESQRAGNASSWTVLEGQCSMECNVLPVFMLFFFCIVFFTFMASMPALSATLRCIPESSRSLALGIQWLTVRAFGTIPSAPAVGSIIDSTCSLWEDNCGTPGSCYQYDNRRMGINLMIVGVAMKVVGWAALLVAYQFYKIGPGSQDHEDSKTDPAKLSEKGSKVALKSSAG